MEKKKGPGNTWAKLKIFDMYLDSFKCILKKPQTYLYVS